MVSDVRAVSPSTIAHAERTNPKPEALEQNPKLLNPKPLNLVAVALSHFAKSGGHAHASGDTA